MKLDRDKFTFKFKVSPLIMFSYFLFVFSVPFEILSGVMHFGLAKMTGYLFMATTLVQPRLCWRPPHKAFWFFATWIFVYFISGIIHDPINLGIIDPSYFERVLIRMSQYIQLVILFWLSVNLMSDEKVINGTMLSLASANIVIVILQRFGIGVCTIQSYDYTRVSALGIDPNTFCSILVIGFIALIGLAYGRLTTNNYAKFLILAFAGLVIYSIAVSGSKTGTVAVFAGLIPFVVLRVGRISSIRTRIIVLIFILIVAFVIMNVDVSRQRWEKTIYEGSTSHRLEIMEVSWKSFLAQPVLGAGPMINLYLVGLSLTGMQLMRDTHNMYLWMLTEVGLLGAIPFFIGLYMCFIAAWRARHGSQGVLPIALFMTILAINITLTWHTKKVFWLVLSYVAACEFHTTRIDKKPYVAPHILK